MYAHVFDFTFNYSVTQKEIGCHALKLTGITQTLFDFVYSIPFPNLAVDNSTAEFVCQGVKFGLNEFSTFFSKACFCYDPKNWIELAATGSDHVTSKAVFCALIG